MSSKLKLILSFFFVGLPSITFADDIRLSESYGGDCPVCEEQNRPVIDVEEINAKFEIFTDENNYQWCEEQQRYFVWGKCSGPVLESGVKTKNAIYKHTGEKYNSKLNSLVYEGICEGQEPELKSGVKTKNATYTYTGKVYDSDLNTLVYEGTCEGTCQTPEIKNSGSCEAKVTKDSEGNLQSVECASVGDSSSTCSNDPLFGRIGSVCTLKSDETDCNATSEGTYQCVGDKVVCSGKKPTCLLSCGEIPAPTQGLIIGEYNAAKRFTKDDAHNEGDKINIQYSCVATGADYSKVAEYDAGIFSNFNDKELTHNTFINTIIIGGDLTNFNKGGQFDHNRYKTNRNDAHNVFTNKRACYVCGAVRINGCFAPETKLTLADGSVKQAKEVKAGDELFNPLTKKAVTVERVIEGPEDVGMVSVKTASGELKVSQEHPMLTAKGLVQAKDLKAGDTVFNGDNQEVEVASVEIKPVEEGQYVINFIVKGDGDAKDYKNRMLLSEGVITGDLTTQIELKLGK